MIAALERGDKATRVEAFVDAAFAFALTLLVIAGDRIPGSVEELLQALKSLPAYALGFLLMLKFWTAHVAWSRRYGLDDATTRRLSLLLVFVAFSLIDIPLQRFFFLKKMRMTKQEKKEEHKTQEGRPEVKARIRQMQRQLMQRQINKVIKDADVVIVNPQHYAVALRYDPKKAQAPYVIARGIDEMALYIRKMAQAHDREVLELPPLARAIYFTTQVNQQIPTALYTAVAHVLTYVLQLRAWRQGRRGKPVLSRHLPIPESLANRGLT